MGVEKMNIGFFKQSERVDWVAQKVEERKTINAVRVMKRFENGSNPPAFSSMPNIA